MSQEHEDLTNHPIRDSQHDPSGGMGVSSEREGHTGPGQYATDGVKDVTWKHEDDEAVPPEQRPGAEEENPAGLEPKAGYPKLDPRSSD